MASRRCSPRRAAAANEHGISAAVAVLAGSSLVGSPLYAPCAAIAVNERYRQPAVATGLHQAMYQTVVLSGALVVVLLAAARTMPRNYERLQKWMKAQADGPGSR